MCMYYSFYLGFPPLWVKKQRNKVNSLKRPWGVKTKSWLIYDLESYSSCRVSASTIHYNDAIS